MTSNDRFYASLKACTMSAIRSDGCSMPIDSRIVESSCSKQCNALMQTHKPCASVARRSSVVRHDQGPHGATHFFTKTLPKIAAEMALPGLAYDLTRVVNTVGVIKPLMAAIAA